MTSFPKRAKTIYLRNQMFNMSIILIKHKFCYFSPYETGSHRHWHRAIFEDMRDMIDVTLHTDPYTWLNKVYYTYTTYVCIRRILFFPVWIKLMLMMPFHYLRIKNRTRWREFTVSTVFQCYWPAQAKVEDYDQHVGHDEH